MRAHSHECLLQALDGRDVSDAREQANHGIECSAEIERSHVGFEVFDAGITSACDPEHRPE